MPPGVARLVKIHAAHARIGAAAAGEGGRLRTLRRTVGVGGEGGEFVLQVILPAGPADEGIGIVGAAHELFEFAAAVFTTIFVDWHDG